MTDEKKYRKSVGAVIVNDDGFVFCANRVDTPYDCWQFPQGGIKSSESLVDALKREVEEETNITELMILTQLKKSFKYKLPNHLTNILWGSKYLGQEQHWFLCKFTGNDEQIDVLNRKYIEFIDWKWAPFREVVDQIVDFKKDIYLEIYSQLANKYSFK